VRADWTTGAVGMTGVSYDATLNGLVVAPHSNTQGVGENFYLGEDTDVLARFTAGNERNAGPCAHVLQRLAEQQDRTTGDYNRFWRERDYLRRARAVRASVFLVHGLNDGHARGKVVITV
jgi:X-Pro dipeptidyl-peptidase